MKVGLPTAIQMVVVNTAYLLVAGMLNPFGTSVAAASGVGLKINTFAGMHCWAIGQAITAIVGQCMGAGQIRRARQVVRSGLLLNLAVTTAVVVTVQFLAEPLIRLFDNTSPEMIRVGVLYLRLCCGVNSLVYSALLVATGRFAYNGAERSEPICSMKTSKHFGNPRAFPSRTLPTS